jgi:caspase domain-containing protein
MPSTAALTIVLSANVSLERLEELTRSLRADLEQSDVPAELPPEITGVGSRGDPVTIGMIALALLNSPVVVALIECLKAYIEREPTLRFAFRTPDGRDIPVDADDGSSVEEAVGAALSKAGIVPESGPYRSEAPRTAGPRAGDMRLHRRIAILIGNETYLDPGLANLGGPANDVAALASVLEHPERGGYDVRRFIDRPASEVWGALDEAFGEAQFGDEMLIYYAGHGKLDAAGRLCLAGAETRSKALYSTSIPVRFLCDMVEHSRCVATVLLLDCCYSGAISAEVARGDVDSQIAFLGQTRGLYSLSASTAVQAAREAEVGPDGAVHGRFTAAIVSGIETGEADHDGDGYVSIVDLNAHLQHVLRGQTPQLDARKATGMPPIIAQIRPRDELRLDRLGRWHSEGLLRRADYLGLVEAAEGIGDERVVSKVRDLLDDPKCTARAVLATWRGPSRVPADAPESLWQPKHGFSAEDNSRSNGASSAEGPTMDRGATTAGNQASTAACSGSKWSTPPVFPAINRAKAAFEAARPSIQVLVLSGVVAFLAFLALLTQAMGLIRL